MLRQDDKNSDKNYLHSKKIEGTERAAVKHLLAYCYLMFSLRSLWFGFDNTILTKGGNS